MLVLSRVFPCLAALTVVALSFPATGAESDNDLIKRVEFCTQFAHNLNNVTPRACRHYDEDMQELRRRNALRKQNVERQREADRKANIQIELKHPSTWCVTINECYPLPPQCLGLVPGTTDRLRRDTAECRAVTDRLRQEKQKIKARGWDNARTTSRTGRQPTIAIGSAEDIAQYCGGGREPTPGCQAYRRYLAKRKRQMRQ